MSEYIDREAVYKSACAGCTRHGEEIGSCFSYEPCEKLIFAFTTAPAADVVERKRGEWVINERGFAECTECKFERIGIPLVHRLNFCPNCGADMRSHHDSLCDQTEEVEPLHIHSMPPFITKKVRKRGRA